MEPEVSFPRSQSSASELYPEPVEPTQHQHTYVTNIPFTVLLPSTPRSIKWYLPLRFSN
jgi:hypothetical protein